MKIGIPQGLVFSKYHVFARTFLEEMGAETVISPATNKAILDEGVRCCVDEACLPMKVFHGHVAWLRDKCDAIFVPRLISIKQREHICPMFCGLIEMLKNDIHRLPVLIDTPIYSFDREKLFIWAKKTGYMLTVDESLIEAAFKKAFDSQLSYKAGLRDEGYKLKIGLIGHAYNINDKFINMDLKKKLNRMGIGVITAEYISGEDIDAEVSKLYKKPFWTYAKEYYGAAVNIYKEKKADGLIYLSSFSCGIDSVITELIKNEIGDFPLLILKLDEHTGEAGYDTRIDAFSDMLKRRRENGRNISKHG